MLDWPPGRWRSADRLLDTIRSYERFPNQVSLATLGGRSRLLGLHDYRHDEDERDPDPHDAAEAWAAQRPAYYSLRQGRRVRYDDLFGPGLAAVVGQAARPLLRRVRQQRRQPPLTAAHYRELARPRYWAFTNRGWYAVYLADGLDEEQPGYRTRRYRLDMEVLIPYARLRAYLRP